MYELMPIGEGLYRKRVAFDFCCNLSDATCPSAGGHAECRFLAAAFKWVWHASIAQVGAAECCTPALLLQSGDAWELERCDCVTTDDISCGGQGTGRILQGFNHWR